MHPNFKNAVLKAINRTWNDLAPSFGRQHLSHSEGTALLMEYFGPGKIPLTPLVGGTVEALLPGVVVPSDELLLETLRRIDTDEKLGAILEFAPDVSEEQCEYLVTLIRSLLPGFRALLEGRVANLPRAVGGRPKVISPNQYARIRLEIQQLRGPGVKLSDIYKRLALKYNASPASIKRIWIMGK